MNGASFTVVGAIVTVALAYWAIGYGKNLKTLGTGVGSGIGDLGRAFTAKPPGTGA